VLSYGFLSANGKPQPQNNVLMALRFIVNLFQKENITNVAYGSAGVVLENATDFAKSDNKNIRIALANVLLNYSVLLHQRKNSELNLQCLSVLVEFLSTEKEAEVIFRIIVAIGTLIFNDKDTKETAVALDLATTLQVPHILDSADIKVKESTQDLLKLLK